MRHRLTLKQLDRTLHGGIRAYHAPRPIVTITHCKIVMRAYCSPSDCRRFASNAARHSTSRYRVDLVDPGDFETKETGSRL
jgi:hypothetical protein